MSYTLYDYIIIADCGQGQRKEGVEKGGEYICKQLLLKSEYEINKIQYELFNNIEQNEKNGYELLSNLLRINNADFKKTLLIGGDHSLGISSVDAFLNIYKEDLSVLWIDAHADINDHFTSLSGNLHGMSLGYHHEKRRDKLVWRKNQLRLKSSQLYYFGIRDLDLAEEELIKSEMIGYSVKPDDNLKKFIDKSKYLLISFDVDALDPTYMDSTGVMAPNGLTPDEVKNIISYANYTQKLVHIDLMEFNPMLGNPKKSISSLKYIFDK